MKTAFVLLLTANVALATAGATAPASIAGDGPASRVAVAAIDIAALNAKIRWHEAFDRFDPGAPAFDFSAPVLDDGGTSSTGAGSPATGAVHRDREARLHQVVQHVSRTTARPAGGDPAFPEPGNWALLIAGFLSAAAIARRRVRS